MSLTLLDGREQDLIAVSDRALSYGDGLFETVAVVSGRLCLWQRHCKRLKKGCETLQIPFNDYDALESEASQLAKSIGQGSVKIIISSGSGPRGYRRPDPVQPIRIVSTYAETTDHQRFYQEGIAATICQMPISIQKALAGVKHLNRLEQVMARGEWGSQYQEGVMLDSEGYVREGTMSNLFMLKNGYLLTPSLEHCGVHGVMREWIIEHCDEIGIRVEYTDMLPDALLQSDGLFFCNAVIRAWPVRTLQDHEYDIGIMHAFLERLPFDDIAHHDN